jgi:spore coat protein U domain-containing protein, fimbrial subunit CupE1/2/3/6
MRASRTVNPAMSRSRLLLGCLIATAGSPAIGATCTVQSAGLVFGAYDSLSPAALDGVGDINVNCDAETSFTVGLGAGSGTGARQMQKGASALAYNLYTDASRTFVWGDGAAQNAVSATGTTVVLPVYGRIAAHQNVPAGEYVDTIVITVSY